MMLRSASPFTIGVAVKSSRRAHRVETSKRRRVVREEELTNSCASSMTRKRSLRSDSERSHARPVSCVRTVREGGLSEAE